MIVPEEAPGRVIRDPVYGYIRLPDSLAPLVDHPLYQRMRRVAQTSMASSVYPSATGSRFEHGLGAMHLARLSWSAIAVNSKRRVLDRFHAAVYSDLQVDPNRAFDLLRDALGGAALLHDLGHPPFSHALEPAFRRLCFRWFELPSPRPEVLSARHRLIEDHVARSKLPFHEAAGYVLVTQILEETQAQMESPLPEMIRRIALAKRWDGSWASALHGVIDAEIDIDRLDYLMRDGQRAGTEFGSIDWERLVDSLALLEPEPNRYRVLPKTRARSAVETLLLQRSQAYKWLVFHPRVVGTNLAIATAVDQALRAHGGMNEVSPSPLPGLGTPAPWPDLNYLEPRPEHYAAAEGTEDEGRRASLVAHFGASLQSSCDDGRLLEHLKTFALSEAWKLYAPDDSVSADAVSSARRSLALLGTVLYRRKSFLTVWKSYEEFRAVVQSLVKRKQLPDRIAAVYDAAIERASSPERAEHLETRRELALRRLSGPDVPVAGFNHYLKVCVSGENQRRLLEDRLRQQPSRLPEGFWLGDYLWFESVRESGTLAELVDDDGKVQRVRDSWGVAQGLIAADKTRVGLFLFYFVTAEAPSHSWEKRTTSMWRDALRGAFVEVFPGFLTEQLAMAIEGEEAQPAGASA